MAKSYSLWSSSLNRLSQFGPDPRIAMDCHTQVVRRSFTISNKLGLHARAAAKLVQITNQFQSRIRLLKNGQEADAKSILGILTLSCPQGTQIEVHAEGEDAAEAVKALALLIENNFGEE